MPLLTPNIVKLLARLGFVGLVAFVGAVLALGGSLSDSGAALVGYAVTVAILFGLPKTRRANVAAIAAILLVVMELLTWIAQSQEDFVHAAYAGLGLCAAMLPSYARDVRLRAAMNGRMSFAEWRELERLRRDESRMKLDREAVFEPLAQVASLTKATPARLTVQRIERQA